MDRLRVAVGDADNAEEINKCVKECLAEGISISEAFDYCASEEAVDALVAAGGNPSVTDGVFENKCILAHQACLNITRRLYHGARGLHKEDLLNVKDLGEIIVEFAYFSKSLASPPTRPEYYVGVDQQKFDFWLKFKPSVYSTEGYQPEEIVRDGLKLFIVENGRTMFMRPDTHVKRGRKVLKTLYIKKELTVEDWEEAERAFGEYHRRANILISCEREHKSKKSRRLVKPRGVETSCRRIRHLMYSLPIEVAREVCAYV